MRVKKFNSEENLQIELATLPIRIYELKRLIKANGPKREPIEVETIEKYIEMMENCVKKGGI